MRGGAVEFNLIFISSVRFTRNIQLSTTALAQDLPFRAEGKALKEK